MTLWFVFALMTAAAIFAVLWPLSRRAPRHSGGSDIVVYHDQLDEIARDRAAGLIGEVEAHAARVEVSRRLIAAADAAESEKTADGASSNWPRRGIALASLVLLPIGAAALYLTIGSPQLPGKPLAARLRAIHQNSPIAKLVAQVEAHLAKDPDDARGYEVLAPVYLQIGRYADAVNADRKVIALSGATAERQADLGEALMAEANGVVTGAAKAAFERALKLNPKQLKARFYIAVAAKQDGQTDKAIAIWRGMLAAAPPGASWVKTVQHALAGIGHPVVPAATTAAAKAPAPSAADVATVSKMNAKDRGAFIHSMVARLADRLKQNGNDLDGWQRLLRAYVVLGESNKALAAAAHARKALAGDPAKLQRIENIIQSLGLNG